MASPGAEGAPTFVSLGMVILDELRCPGKAPMLDIPGGSGAFSVLGARLVAGREHAGHVGCFILAGYDFPAAVLGRFQEWGVDLVVKTDAARPSTRGLLEYQDSTFSRKVFRYTTTPLQPTDQDLPSRFRAAAAFHLLANPADAQSQARALASLRPSSDGGGGATAAQRPLLVWEPAPLHCSQAMREAHLAAAGHVDVFSPNHLELMALFQGPVSEADAEDFRPQTIEAYADAFLDAGIGPDGNGTMVVRTGGYGCLVASRQIIPGRHRWLPAYHDDAVTVVDATGAGNTFLGALTFSMAQGKSPLEAAALASVAASFSLEQIGLPRQDDPTQELWNGAGFKERYKIYQKRMTSRTA